MAENFIWLALPNDEADSLLIFLKTWHNKITVRDEVYDAVGNAIKRLERQINGV